MQQQISIKCVDRKSVKTECNCDCCQGRCNHAATPCHRPYEVVERWEITLPNGETLSKSLSYMDDDWKRCVRPGVAEIVIQALEQNGYRVFKYENSRSDFYYYSKGKECVVSPLRGDIYVVSQIKGHSARGPWFGHTDVLDTSYTLVVVPPHVTEAEWEVVEWGWSNVPHNVDVLVRDEETGEEYVALEQCWCRREWRIVERVVYHDGKVSSEVVESWEKCEKRNNQ
jgi:hypothetical protein